MDQGNLAYIDGGELPNTRQTIFAHIQDGLCKNPHGPAVICMHQKKDYAIGMVDFDPPPPASLSSPPSPPHSSCSDEANTATAEEASSSSCLTLTYLQLHQTALKLCAGLRGKGIRPGMTLMCLIPNTIEYPLLVWACSLLRITLAAVDLTVLDDESRLTTYLGIVRPDVLILHDNDKEATQTADRAIARQPGLWQCLRAQIHEPSEIVTPGWTSFRALIETGAQFPLLLLRLEEDAMAKSKEEANRICSILFTSGTTSSSQPKACPLRAKSMTHILESQSWLINAHNCARVLQQAHNARAIAYYHTLQTWRAGGTVLMTTGPSFAVEHAVKAILKFGATFVVFSPAMVHALAGCSVKDIQVGGDAVTKEILLKCAALFPRGSGDGDSVRVLVNHGMSEGGGFFNWPFFGVSVAEIPYLNAICPVGTVARGTRVRICDTPSSSSSLYGQPGEMHISSDSLIRNYLGMKGKGEAKNIGTLYNDDAGALWMNTGDVGMVTEDGLVYILGRSKDAIKCNGMSIMPAALESCVERFTGAQSCVVAVPSRTKGNEPFAVVSTLDGFAEDGVQAHVVETLGEAYALRGVASLAQLGLAAYPVSATHKVLKLEVQQLVMQFMKAL
ncbi:acetyl-CoA synthetase-like protein [Xylariaceae sp. FL0255]|nr:acetyl-CoA synthetase-like protein [Xylariaceae sp. FL0255]